MNFNSPNQPRPGRSLREPAVVGRGVLTAPPRSCPVSERDSVEPLGTTKRFHSLSLHRMRGEGWGEGLHASALVALPLIRPAVTFSPPPRKGEGALRGVRVLGSALNLRWVGRAVLSPPPNTRMPQNLGGAVRTPRPTRAVNHSTLSRPLKISAATTKP